MKLYKQKYTLIFFLIAGMSFAQSKKDSSWALSGGIDVTWDYYGFYASEKYKLENRLCASINGTVQATKYFGKKKIFGMGLEPHIGISQIAFNAIIPTTDFDNAADSIGVDFTNKIGFYSKGKKLPEQKYTYRINYAVLGTKFYLRLKLSKRLEASVFIGFNHYQYISKNYRSFRLKYKEQQMMGYYIGYTDILYYTQKFWRTFGGLEISTKVSNRLIFNIRTQATQIGHDFSEPYIRFAFTSGVSAKTHENYMNRCFSFGVGLRYFFIK